jgi:hypothetical protein
LSYGVIWRLSTWWDGTAMRATVVPWPARPPVDTAD